MAIASAHLPGEQLGRFELVRRLAAGGMSEVWEAVDGELGRAVAIKLLRSDRLASEAMQARLQREAKVMARLRHPNVAVVHDIGRVGERYFIAMELMRCSLRRWLAEQPRSWRTTVQILLAAGRGVAAAHEAGILHRDIKPDNILIGEAGEVKVADFGLADDGGGSFDLAARIEPCVALTTGEGIAGTPAYMAPEQILGRSPDARADQYSFCVTAWEALFGELPFTPTPAAGVPTLALQLSAITSGAIPRGHARVPRSVERVLRRGLQVDRDERFAKLGELCDALGRATRPRKRLVAGSAAVMVLALAVLATTARISAIASDKQFAVRTLLPASAKGQLVAMARDGEHFVIGGGASLQLVSADGVQQASFALSPGFTPSAVAIAAHGEAVVVGGHLDGRWELWRFRSADGAGHRFAVLPGAMFDGLIEQEQPPSIAIVEPDVMVAIASRVVRIDAAGAVKVIVDDTGRTDRRFGSLRGVPGTRRVSVLEEIGDLTRVRVLELDGTTARVIHTPPDARGHDWLDASRLVLVGNLNQEASLLELDTAPDGEGHARRLGTIGHRVFDLHASPRRLAGMGIDRQLSLVAGSVQSGGWTPMDATGWTPWPVGWLDADTVIGVGWMSGRRSIVAFGLAAPPRVLQQDAPGVPVFHHGNQLLLQEFSSGRCILHDYRDGHAVGERDLGCAANPVLICADRLHEPCILARWEADHRVYRTFDPRTLTTGDVRFIEPEPDRSHIEIYPALSPDGQRLAIPRPAGRMLFVDLRDGRVTAVEDRRGDGWQFATWVPGTTAVLATSIRAGALDNRVDRVDIDGTVATLYEPASGYVLALAVSSDGNRVVITRAESLVSEIVIDLGSSRSPEL